MTLNPNAVQNLRDWAKAIEDSDWYADAFTGANGMGCQSLQTMFEHYTGLTDEELRALMPDYNPCGFLQSSEDFGILFRLFLAEAIESGDIA